MSVPHKSLSIGGATYDLFLSLPSHVGQGRHLHLPRGEKIMIDHVVETAGGGACNTSVGCAKLGFQASFCGVIGADQWGTRLIETLRRAGVDTSPATIVEGETSSFSIILTLPGGERTILSAAGVTEHLHDVTMDLATAADVDVIYLNRLQEASCSIMDDLADLLTGGSATHLTWNPGGCQIAQGIKGAGATRLLPHTALLLLNREEAHRFTGEHDVRRAMTQIIAAGARSVIITDGAQGATATDGVTVWHCQPPNDIIVVDTTGAGDAFGSAATWSLMQGKTLPEALVNGTLNAISVLGRIGAHAGLCDARNLSDHVLRSSVHVDVIT